MKYSMLSIDPHHNREVTEPSSKSWYHHCWLMLVPYFTLVTIALPFRVLGVPLPALNVGVEGTNLTQPIALAIADVVQLAIENNTEIKNAYLDRITQRLDLAVAEDKFKPDLTPNLSLNAQRQTNGRQINQTQSLDIGAQMTAQLPLGSTVDLSWQSSRNLQQQFNSSNDVSQRSLNHRLQLQVTQPLLRGAGVRVNRASVERARVSDRSNILTVKATLMDRVTDAILAYRQLLQRQEALKIARLSLENSRKRLEITKALIDAGLQAPVEGIQAETDVASQELTVLSAKNDLDAARLQLLNLLELDRDLPIVAQQLDRQDLPNLDRDELLALAVENNPEYLRAKFNVEINNYDLIEAADRRRWALDLQTEYDWSPSNLSEDTSNLSVRLNLSHALGDLSRQQQFQQSRISLLKAENTINRQYSELTIDISDRIREIELLFEQVNQSRTARNLAQQQLEVEENKFRFSTSNTSLTDIIQFQNDLAFAKERELNASINYLNALTNLDRTLGLTLERWNLQIEID
ncbi:TolC family protein [Roseofilum casamattae]|uniref:TolC family protein n=1 Tax=Roseofilum casamattae BLCC-M143 TaxID=3022442 RepID=A0ABT7BWY8_9CYAN|nr:TolC family protein [Roseofilum casamattae]MDJ1183590.1 TolC family protein [Roseofilum casamattae BLCC-M143]